MGIANSTVLLDKDGKQLLPATRAQVVWVKTHKDDGSPIPVEGEEEAHESDNMEDSRLADVLADMAEQTNQVEDNVATGECVYNPAKERFEVGGNLKPRSLENSRFVFQMKSRAVRRSGYPSAWLAVDGFNHPVDWLDNPATETNTWDVDEWVDAWYHQGKWYLTYAKTRVSYEIWEEMNVINKQLINDK